MAKAKTKYITRYVSKPRSRRRGGMTLPVAPIVGFLPLISRAITGYQGNGLYGAADGVLSGLTGYSTFDRKFHMDILAQNVLPIAAGFGVHWLATRFGVNRMLARHKIPLIRI